MIAVIRPTRGLEFSESADSIEKALRFYEFRIFRTWSDPIPDCFNKLVAEALKENIDLIRTFDEFLFVEEDVVIPENCLYLMRSLDVDIAAISYPNKVDPSFISEHRFEDDSICWLSLGCTLIRRKVFETLEFPWFVTGKAIARVHPGRKIVLVEAAHDVQYGNQDQYFCFKAREAGLKMETVRDVFCKHLKLEALGAPSINNGCHKILSLEKNRSQI